jgi:L-alanine-DL-glutamate epimerase-like enolase superfamily enzyme
MKITDIRTLQLRRPLDRPQRHARGQQQERCFTFVVVETDAGLTGLGEACGDEAYLPAIVEGRLKPLACGLDPCDIETLWTKLFASRAFWETSGSYVCGISAIEVACWDICGQAEGVPVYELLGGLRRERIEAYASGLHWDEPEAMAELAKRYVDAGFRFLKTHIGAEPEGDLARLEAIRNAVGPDIGLLIDVNTAFDRDAALARGREYAAFEPLWYEEPLPPYDFQGYAWLRQQLPMHLAAGENLYTVHGFEPLLARQGCDFIMPDILRCGGFRQAQRICEAAEWYGVAVSPHSYASGVGLAATLHLMAALPQTLLLEFDPTGTAIYEELFVQPLVVQDGHVRVPSAPGLGVRLTPDIIARYR